MNPKVDLNEMRRLDAEAPSLGYAIPSALSLSKERTVEAKDLSILCKHTDLYFRFILRGVAANAGNRAYRFQS
jgi:hypothetical protein